MDQRERRALLALQERGADLAKVADQAYQAFQENVVRQELRDQADKWGQPDLKVNGEHRVNQAQRENKVCKAHKGVRAREDQPGQEVNLEKRVLVEVLELLGLRVNRVNRVREACLEPLERRVRVVNKGFLAHKVPLDEKAKEVSAESLDLLDHLAHPVLLVSEVRKGREDRQVPREPLDDLVRPD